MLCDYYWLESVRQLRLGGHVVSMAMAGPGPGPLRLDPLACSPLRVQGKPAGWAGALVSLQNQF